MKKISLFAALVFFTQLLFAQFEGVINFEKIKSETTKYTYYVKGKKVRIDEYGSDGKIKGTELIDLDKGTVWALSHDRKLYMDGTPKRVHAASNPKLNKTSNKKTVHGYECTEWLAKSVDEGTEISYWVGGDKFDFFVPLLKTLNRKDRLSKYYVETANDSKGFPFVGTEKAMDGSVRTTLKVTSIEEKAIEDSLFEVPNDFVKFEK